MAELGRLFQTPHLVKSGFNLVRALHLVLNPEFELLDFLLHEFVLLEKAVDEFVDADLEVVIFIHHMEDFRAKSIEILFLLLVSLSSRLLNHVRHKLFLVDFTIVVDVNLLELPL